MCLHSLYVCFNTRLLAHKHRVLEQAVQAFGDQILELEGMARLTLSHPYLTSQWHLVEPQRRTLPKNVDPLSSTASIGRGSDVTNQEVKPSASLEDGAVSTSSFDSYKTADEEPWEAPGLLPRGTARRRQPGSSAAGVHPESICEYPA